MVVARPLCVDISKYQGLNVNWKAYVAWAKQWDGIARVIMRSSYGSGGLRDNDFEAHWFWSRRRRVRRNRRLSLCLSQL